MAKGCEEGNTGRDEKLTGKSLVVSVFTADETAWQDNANFAANSSIQTHSNVGEARPAHSNGRVKRLY